MRRRDSFEQNKLFGQALIISLGALTILAILTIGG